MTAVNWTAQWIWTAGEPSPVNFFLAARRDFEVDPADTLTERRLHIAADTRYRLYLNGEWLGDGPARSFYFNQQFDTYDVTGLMRPGRNTLAAVVNHFGEGTFQYQPSGQAGLLAQLERRGGAGWTAEIVTDDQWLARRHGGYQRPTPRICCQQPFVEVFDARAMDPDWMRPEAPAEGFTPAHVVGPVGEGPWKNLVARTIPFLTRTPVLPVRPLHVGLTQPASLHIGFNTRPYLLPGFRMQNSQALRGFVAAIVHSPVEQEITIHRVSFRHEPPVINGEETSAEKPGRLRAGDNLLLVPFAPGGHHIYDRSYPIFVEQPVTLHGVFGGGGEGDPGTEGDPGEGDPTWTIFGPFENWPELYPQARNFAQVADLEPYREKAQAVGPLDTYFNCSPFGETEFSRPVAGEPKIDGLDALMSDDARPTVFHPDPRGAATFFLDFGREQVGYTELDLEGPAGAVVDLLFIEEIEEDVRIHYPEDSECSLRYVTRAGRQRYTSMLRRGYRYAKVTVRDLTAPLRVRSIHTLFSAYPSVQRGSFDCSDSLLTRIWEVGRHTLRCCSEDTFTDCPLYEQTFWVGDARNEALVNYAAFGDGPLTRRCTDLVPESLFRQPIPESQVPSAWDNLLPAWSYLWVLMVEEHFGFSGNHEFLEKIFPAVRATMRNTREQFTDERGLFSIAAWNMFDWAGIDDGHKVVTHNQMFIAGAYASAARMAEILGAREDAAWFTREREALVAAINAHLWDEAKGAYIDSIHDDGARSPKVCQQANSLAILYEVAPAARLARIRDVAAAPPEGMTKVGSPFALFYILEALAAQGRQADLLRVTRQSWGEMIKLGATTFWETFPGYDPRWWTRSYCHAWSSAPVYFLSRYQLGAWWAEPGYKKALIAPQPVGLTWAKGKVPTPAGEIEVSWERSEDAFVIGVTLPQATAATVVLPVDANEYGKLTAEGVDAASARKVDGQWQLELPAGASVKLTASR